MNKISRDELERYLWGSAVLLRTNIDAGAYKQYIFPLLFFKRINDVYEEETVKAVKENGRKQRLGKKPIIFRYRMELIGMMSGMFLKTSERPSLRHSVRLRRQTPKSCRAFSAMLLGRIRIDYLINFSKIYWSILAH